MSGLLGNLNIPTNYDADVDIALTNDTMVFLGGIFVIYLLAKKKGIV